VVSLGLSTSVRAYEDQLSLGVGGGYANAAAEASEEAHGGLLLAEIGYGPSDIWTLRGVAGAAHHPGAAAFTRLMLGPELLYLIDVFEWVPYFGGGFMALATLSSASDAFDVAVHPVVGIDYLWSREVVVGAALRPVFVLTSAGEVPMYFTGSLTVSWLLDL
jgi:hypothetical protein